MLDEFHTTGFALCPGAIAEDALARLLDSCTPAANTEQVRHRSGATYGIRALLWSNPALQAELDTSGLSAIARGLVGAHAFAIDAIFFDKLPHANWAVPGHQDRLMPVDRSSALPLTTRHGIAYAEPSQTTLAGLVALRVHFDAAGPADGGLEVVPGSHRIGVLTSDAIRAIPLSEYRECTAAAGDVLAMRPLLLHRSGRRLTTGQRRVLHVVYATDQPQDGARWLSSI
jgi:hypothetical protein